MRRAASVSKEQLVALGVCFGKFTKTGKFRLHITALDYLAPYAKVNKNHSLIFVWLQTFRFLYIYRYEYQ